MSWKQPIPTDLDTVFGEDYLSMNLYIHLLLNAAIKDGFWTDEKTKRTFAVKRGEVVFGRNRWCKKIGVSPKTVERVLHKISEKYQKVTYSTEQNFTRVSIINYDEILDMTSWRPIDDPLMTTSNIVNIKEIKKENTTYSPKKERKAEGEAYLSAWNKTFGTNYTSTVLIEKYLVEWLKSYTIEDICNAVEKIKDDPYWKDKDLDPIWLLRYRDNNGEIDRIGKMLNTKKVRRISWGTINEEI